MTYSQRSLIFIAYAPALTDDVDRVLAVVHGMERALPGLRLEWRVSEEGKPIALPQRDTWLAGAVEEGGFPLLCNGDESYPITVTGWERPAGSTPGGKPLFEVHANLPLDAAVIAAGMDLLDAMAEGAQALWGKATPDDVALAIAEQSARTVSGPPWVFGPPSPPHGLPVLKQFEELRAPEIPGRLGWLNYWSAAAARAIGFPDPARDADLLSRSRRTASGGWIVPLTEAPMDLDHPSHLDALLRAYERFPEIGGRASP